MSVKRLSPTADLLRHSRLFALPNALPRPGKLPIPHDFGRFSNQDSDTATQPYPTHAALETTEAGLGRGDWGLKRPLPLRSTTRSSTPTVRIGNIDSIDHITDFASAADHVLTLRKLQELDMPVSVLQRSRSTKAGQYLSPPVSVFEPDVDNIAADPETVQERWKFKGPWLAGQDEFEFESFLKQKVRKRKEAFREFLRLRIARSRAARLRREAVESGVDLGDSSENIHEDSSSIDDEEIDHFMKQLGQNQDKMHQILAEFLDLPREQSEQKPTFGGASYNLKGPPKTHPSAGLSYLRTASHTFNHPIHGPQMDKTPIRGRVLKAQGVPSQTGRHSRMGQAMVGIAGVVARDPQQPFVAGDQSPDIEMTNPNRQGGGKVWTHPKRAEIDVAGAIQLSYKRGETNAINVLLRDRGEVLEETLPAAAIKSYNNRSVPDLAPSRPRGTTASNGYGLEDLAPARSPRAEPLTPRSDIAKMLKGALEGRKSPSSTK